MINLRERILAFDFLRALAIISIIFSHMHYFLPSNTFWNNSQNIFMLFGLGIFTFISGLLIDINYSKKIDKFSDILEFYKQRAIRILPLNWISIVLSLIITFSFIQLLLPNLSVYYPSTHENFIGLFSQFIGLQLLVINSNSFNWFVGLIIICYIIYPIIIKFSKNIFQKIGLSFLPLLIFFSLRYALNLIDDRLFIFYTVFMAGVLISQVKYSLKYYSYKKLFLLIAIFTVSTFIFFWRGGVNFYNHPILNDIFLNFIIYEVVLLNIAIITGCISLLLLLNLKPVNSVLKKYSSIIVFIAISSYCVYLFHFPILAIGQSIILMFNIPEICAELLIYLLIIPLTFLFSYFIQKKESAFREKIFNRKLKKS